MLDSGYFVLYNSNNKITWQTSDIPTNTLLQGQRHAAGQELVSSVSESDQSTGIFRLYAVGTALLPENMLTGVLLHMEMEVI